MYMGGPVEVLDNNGYVLKLKGGDGRTFTVNKSQFDHGGMTMRESVNESKDIVYKKGQRIIIQLTHKGGVGKYANAMSKSKNKARPSNPYKSSFNVVNFFHIRSGRLESKFISGIGKHCTSLIIPEVSSVKQTILKGWVKFLFTIEYNLFTYSAPYKVPHFIQNI